MAGRIENLKPFKPGQSGNPGGRPKGTSVSAILNRKLAEEADDGRTNAEKVATVILSLALEGDPRFVEMLLQRTEGKVVERVINLTPDDVKRMPTEELEALVSGSGGR